MSANKQKRLIAIGEALIDMIPQEQGAIKDVSSFEPHVGGAPCNVAGAYAKLGGRSSMITQLGQDPFGDKIMEELQSYGIDCSMIARTSEANTSLAFVSLHADGNREFSFYRKLGADMLLRPQQLRQEWFADCYVLHFCSVSIGPFPMKEAHKQAIAYAADAGAMISFDPNVRLPLWDDPSQLKEAIWEFIPYAEILKISDEELAFITGLTDIQEAKKQLLDAGVSLLLYTCGKDGAWAITKDFSVFEPSVSVTAVDTTGAGDAFIGSFLYQCAQQDISAVTDITKEQMHSFLKRSAAFCAASIQYNGAISSYPNYLEELEKAASI